MTPSICWSPQLPKQLRDPSPSKEGVPHPERLYAVFGRPPNTNLRPYPLSCYMPSQSHLTHTRGGGLCLLSLDAGGPLAVSQLRILNRIMDRVISRSDDTHNYQPCAVFDIIGGTGTAGFISILLVVFGMTASEAFDEFTQLSDGILGKRGLDAVARTRELRAHLEKLLERHGFKSDTRLLDRNERSKGCKLVVPISYKDDSESTCVLRNFRVRQEQTPNVTITQALMATLATSTQFTPATVYKDAATFEYISGDLALSNPIREIIFEAHNVFGPERRIANLLSLGCGHPGVIATLNNSQTTGWNQFPERLVSNSERQARSVDSQMGHLGIYFRFSVTGGINDSKRKGSPDFGEIIAHTEVYLEDGVVSQKVDTCVDFLKIRDGVASLEQLKYSGGERILAPPLPPLAATFVMRKRPWEFIERKLLGNEGLDGSQILVITGMGGCGKTQLILKFMHLYEESFASVFFIDSSSKDRLRANIVRHVRSLGPEHSQKSFEDCRLFLAQPSSNGRRLILYDNVDDPDLEMAPLLPRGKSCTIVITSRNRLVGGLCPEGHLELDVMSLDESVELLLHNSNDQDRNEACDIAQALGCLPLALQQARSYMFQTKCSARTYLERLETSRDKLLAQPIGHRLDNSHISTYAAFDASFDKLASRDQKLLRLLVFFHWSNFPLQLVLLAAKHNFNDYETKYVENGDDTQIGKALLEEIFLRNGTWDVTNMDEMTNSVQNYSLVALVPGENTMLLQMHPLAHGWIRSSIPGADRDNYQSAAVLLLSLGARRDHTPSAKYLSSHAAYMSGIRDQLSVNDAEAFGRILSDGGLFDDAIKLRERVVAELKNQGYAHSVLFSDALWLLAIAYSNAGRLSEAEVLQGQVMSLRKDFVQEDDPTILAAYISLANTYRVQRRFEDAEALQTKVLRLRREALGTRNVDTMIALNHLALTYSDSGQLEKAERLQVQILELSKELRGHRHPDTIVASGDLAQTYLKLGWPRKALPLQLETVRLNKEVHGERHPETSKGTSQLALIYSALGEFRDAEMLQEEVLRHSTETRGERHPVTISASSYLAISYYELGRFKEAETTQEGVLKLRKEVLGERHLDTIAASSHLARTYSYLGRSDEARWLREEVWRRTKEILGEDHFDTIEAAKDLMEGTTQEEKIARCDEILKQIERTRGKNHPDYITALSRHYDRYEGPRAQVFRLEILNWRRENLPENHPDTLAALMKVALDYRTVGRFLDAKRLLLDVVRLRRETCGERHPETVAALSTLAITYQVIERLAEAESLQQEVVKILKETRGDGHELTMSACLTLADLYYSLGRFEEAERLEADTLALYTEVSGLHRNAGIKPRIPSGTLGRRVFRWRSVLWRGIFWAWHMIPRFE